MPPSSVAPASTRRRKASEARRAAILDAAFDLFVAEGFAAARLDDIAARAGVAKGTIYLFFKDKQDLFEQVALSAIGPILDGFAARAHAADASFAQIVADVFDVFEREILTTPRREIVRLVMTEGVKFPKIAEFYHREIVSRGLALIAAAARRAHERGELPSDALARFPQLFFGPLLVSVVWKSLFDKFAPLDIAGLLAAHRELLLSGDKVSGKRK